jgi:hypothetical protein
MESWPPGLCIIFTFGKKQGLAATSATFVHPAVPRLFALIVEPIWATTFLKTIISASMACAPFLPSQTKCVLLELIE